MIKVEKSDVEEKYLIDSKRCCLVVNKLTGREFQRSDKPYDKWEILYTNAAKRPDEFECYYDKAITKATEFDKRYTTEELEGYGMPKLREIGRALGVTGNSKRTIIQNILEMQDTSVEE